MAHSTTDSGDSSLTDYNNNKLRVALLGPAGAEGLSFKGTQLVQVLDPHWNNVRTRQQQGRGIRFDSHLGLPEDLQNVTVQRFVSRLPLGIRDRFLESLGFNREKGRHGADDYLRLMSARKDKLNEQFINLLKEVGSGGHRTPKTNGHSVSMIQAESTNPGPEQILEEPQRQRRSVIQMLYEMLFGRQKRSMVVPDPVIMSASDDKPLTIEPLLPPVPDGPRPKQKPSDLVAQLRQVKAYSDQRAWDKKNALLIDLLNKYPYQWEVANDPTVPAKFVSVKHWPTGFRYHMPRAYVPSAVYADIRARKQPALAVA